MVEDDLELDTCAVPGRLHMVMLLHTQDHVHMHMDLDHAVCITRLDVP